MPRLRRAGTSLAAIASPMRTEIETSVTATMPDARLISHQM
jgi:hypothetical protein